MRFVKIHGIGFVLYSVVSFLGICSNVGALEITREAESADKIVFPMKIYNDDDAYSGQYISSSQNNLGEAVYQVMVSQGNSYILSVRSRTPSSSKNSIIVKVDNNTAQIWHLPVSESFNWSTYPNPLKLTAGIHTIRLIGRESFTDIDVFRLTSIESPLDPAKAPGQNFDLSLWKLQLPIDKNGNLGGVSSSVFPIASTYQIKPYFYTGADGSMVFMAPTNGATTDNTAYPRTELREMTADGKLAAWTVAKGGSLNATLAVNELPITSSGSVGNLIIAQIHAASSSLCKLYYSNGVIFFEDSMGGPNGTRKRFWLKSNNGQNTKIPLNSKFDYQIKIANNVQTVTVRYNGETYTASEPINSKWQGREVYFKAGNYVQVGDDPDHTHGTGRGRVSFYKLPKPSHP
jgi:hypothetical protein